MLGILNPKYFDDTNIYLNNIFDQEFNNIKIESKYDFYLDMKKDFYNIKNALQNKVKLESNSNTNLNLYYFSDFMYLKSIGIGDYSDEINSFINQLIELEFILDDIDDGYGINEYNKRMSLMKIEDMYHVVDQIKSISKEIINVESKRRRSDTPKTFKSNYERFKDQSRKIYGYVRSLFRRSEKRNTSK